MARCRVASHRTQRSRVDVTCEAVCAWPLKKDMDGICGSASSACSDSDLRPEDGRFQVQYAEFVHWLTGEDEDEACGMDWSSYRKDPEGVRHLIHLISGAGEPHRLQCRYGVGSLVTGNLKRWRFSDPCAIKKLIWDSGGIKWIMWTLFQWRWLRGKTQHQTWVFGLEFFVLELE